MHKVLISIYLSTSFLLFGSLAARAGQYDRLLEEIERNNSTLEALRSTREADRLEARTGLTPDDPSVDLGYLWETKDSQGGYRIDLSVTQSFDFPSVYYWRKKLSDGALEAASLRYEQGRKEILLQAEKLCVELTYFNAFIKALEQGLKTSGELLKKTRLRFECGDASLSELNGMELAHLSTMRTLDQNRIERQGVLDALRTLNGGREISHEISEFSIPMLPESFEEWYRMASESSSELRIARNEAENAEKGVSLAKSEWLPKFSLGYVSERVSGSTLQGIGGGISIPLWANKGKVKAAQARQKAAGQMLEDQKISFFSAMRSKYDKVSALSSVSERYGEQLSRMNSSAALSDALMAGEIGFADYASGMQLWYNALCELLETERDCRLLLCELEYFAR